MKLNPSSPSRTQETPYQSPLVPIMSPPAPPPVKIFLTPPTDFFNPPVSFWQKEFLRIKYLKKKKLMIVNQNQRGLANQLPNPPNPQNFPVFPECWELITQTRQQVWEWDPKKSTYN
ncbi:uncharacterized protein PGTG_18393 [Puccinia graminis f. sp. tritici CRL 75-36-700-3]|uniref:Uncharacterized protein n=1 Tax=Puccinia graminis f. sp. tritici (strain CRL 75-36-700-3 / race SCCL) TaxID=418459 RepID=E3L5W7_PUCGT|nr:uncharacterized protein PGTG_18393 [Puccinia graminis f. sp. tritici CRL 75-36-700-3]EFP91942.1 hypothetical protein PGTG_18393 [Puccinia graminis f. sp. tritici CRL 75-36-700-3]